MKFADRLAALNRLQRTRWFKIIASIVVLAAGIAIAGTYAVSRASRGQPLVALTPEPKLDENTLASMTPEQKAEAEAAKAERQALEATAKAVNDVLSVRADPTAALVGVSAITLVMLAVVWLGLGLTGLLVLVVIGSICFPLVRFGSGFWSSIGQFLGGVGVLGFSFVVLMEVLRLALSASHPVTAIARNVVNEAVRMKVSLVFIVLLLLMLAAVPKLLDPSNPLRYRVQSFIQYGTGGTFWLIAILTVFLAVGTVAYEQRDRVIWQTMTKPVASWQYLLGKWLGVVGVSAVLLGVSATGVFLFTEYLRAQKAQGESAPYVASGGRLISEDRLILETQVLTARRSIGPQMPQLNEEGLQREVARRAELAKLTDQRWEATPANLNQLVTGIRNEVRTSFLTIEAGGRQQFEFKGLKDVKASGRPVTFRFKVDVGSNDPRQSVRITFFLPNMPPRVQEVPLGQMMAFTVSPASIDDEGTLYMQVLNYDVYRGKGIERTMSFPPDGIQVAYPAGSYRANFARVALILWMKLAFLAMVGVCSATFLSFSVASLVSFGTFLIAESTSFLITALDNFANVDSQGNLSVFNTIVRFVAVPVSQMFRFYGELAPTDDLVEGRMLGWGSLVQTMVIMFVVCLGLYAAGVTIFRKRELATYSGQ